MIIASNGMQPIPSAALISEVVSSKYAVIIILLMIFLYLLQRIPTLEITVKSCYMHELLRDFINTISKEWNAPGLYRREKICNFSSENNWWIARINSALFRAEPSPLALPHNSQHTSDHYAEYKSHRKKTTCLNRWNSTDSSKRITMLRTHVWKQIHIHLSAYWGPE